MSRISVCIATYRRPTQLALLLNDLSHQTLAPTQIVIVDNDATLSARTVIEDARARLAVELIYAGQPQKNISLTRNLSIARADGDWLALVDDDERVPTDWLQNLVDAAQHHLAQVVLGPVVALLPDTAPAWLRRGRFYDWARMPTGTVVPANRLRLGNALFHGDTLRAERGPFDPAYGLTGGEDGDLLARLAQRGARIVWCDEAGVQEPVAPSRQSLRWLLRRALRGGQDFARHSTAGRYGPFTMKRRCTLILRAGAQLLLATLLTLAFAPFSRHRSARWLVAASANLGKLSLFCGWHYQEYA